MVPSANRSEASKAPCNVAIGHMRDDPDLLRLAAAYLTDWRAES